MDSEASDGIPFGEIVGHSTCLNCGGELQGEYCSHCGQSAHEGRAPTMRHFLHDVAHEFLHVDGRLGRTLKALLRPGFLTTEYWAGRIVQYVRPLRIFLVMVAVNLLVVHNGVGPVNLQVAVDKNAAGDMRVNLGQDLNDMRHMRGFQPVPEQERKEFFEKFGKAYSALRYSSVLLFASASWLLYRRRQPYFVNHLVFGLHYYSVWYALALVGSLNGRISRLMLGASLIFLVLSLRRVYRQGWLLLTLKSGVLFVWLVIVETELGIAAANMVEHNMVPPGLH